MTPIAYEEVKKNVQELLDNGLIRENSSSCVMFVLIAPKKHGS